jgi:hypothetical protein
MDHVHCVLRTSFFCCGFDNWTSVVVFSTRVPEDCRREENDPQESDGVVHLILSVIVDE